MGLGTGSSAGTGVNYRALQVTFLSLCVHLFIHAVGPVAWMEKNSLSTDLSAQTTHPLLVTHVNTHRWINISHRVTIFLGLIDL